MNNKLANTFLILTIVVMSAWITPGLKAETPEAEEQKGLIVFYRVKKGAGSAIPIGVHYSGGSVGTLKNGASFQKYFAPGEYTFWSKVITEDSVTLTVEAGNTYYIRGDVRMGFYIGRPKLKQTQVLESR